MEYSQNIRLYWVMYTVPYLNYQLAMKKISLLSQPKSVGYSGRALVFRRLGLLRSGHAMLGPFSQSIYSTVLDERSTNLLPSLFRRAAFNLGHINRITTVCYSHKNGNFLYRCIEFNVPRTNINIKIAVRH